MFETKNAVPALAQLWHSVTVNMDETSHAVTHTRTTESQRALVDSCLIFLVARQDSGRNGSTHHTAKRRNHGTATRSADRHKTGPSCESPNVVQTSEWAESGQVVSATSSTQRT